MNKNDLNENEQNIFQKEKTYDSDENKIKINGIIIFKNKFTLIINSLRISGTLDEFFNVLTHEEIIINEKKINILKVEKNFVLFEINQKLYNLEINDEVDLINIK